MLWCTIGGLPFFTLFFCGCFLLYDGCVYLKTFVFTDEQENQLKLLQKCHIYDKLIYILDPVKKSSNNKTYITFLKQLVKLRRKTWVCKKKNLGRTERMRTRDMYQKPQNSKHHIHVIQTCLKKKIHCRGKKWSRCVFTEHIMSLKESLCLHTSLRKYGSFNIQDRNVPRTIAAVHMM